MVEHIVLFSGGYESTGCLVKALAEVGGDTSKVSAIFFEYGQPYLKQEQRAVRAIANALGVSLMTMVMSPKSYSSNGRVTGVFENRNRAFLLEAHRWEPCADVWFGCRAPWNFTDSYKDSNRQFANEISRRYRMEIITPFILYPKFMVRSVVRKAGLEHLVFSSENYKYE